MLWRPKLFRPNLYKTPYGRIERNPFELREARRHSVPQPDCAIKRSSDPQVAIRSGAERIDFRRRRRVPINRAYPLESETIEAIEAFAGTQPQRAVRGLTDIVNRRRRAVALRPRGVL